MMVFNVQHIYYIDNKHFSLVLKNASKVTADSSHLYLPTDQVFRSLLTNK